MSTFGGSIDQLVELGHGGLDIARKLGIFRHHSSPSMCGGRRTPQLSRCALPRTLVQPGPILTTSRPLSAHRTLHPERRTECGGACSITGPSGGSVLLPPHCTVGRWPPPFRLG